MKKVTILGILCVIGGVLIQITYGYFYTIGNMAPYMIDFLNHNNMSTEKSSAVWLTSVAISLEAVAMPLGGLMERKTGFRIVVLISCLIHSGSIALTYFALQWGFIAVVITYGVLQGFGFGFGYAVIMAVAAMWFPYRRGLIVGLIVGGFGAGSLIFTPIQTSYINPKNIPVDVLTRTFTDADLLSRVPKACLVLSAITAGIQLIGIGLMRNRSTENKDSTAKNEKLNDPKNEDKIGALITNGQGDITMEIEQDNAKNVGPKEALKSADFYLLWFAVCFSVIPITILSSLFKMVGQSFISDDLFLAGVAMASSLCNAGGRVIWGCICDRFSYKLPYCLMLTVWCTLLVSFPHISVLTGIAAKVLYSLWVCSLFLCLSGVFVLAPTATEVMFGAKHLAVNYGLVYNAFIAGSMLAAVLTKAMDQAKGFHYQFTFSGAMCIIALLIILWANDRKLPKGVQFLNWFCKLRGKSCTHVPRDETEVKA